MLSDILIALELLVETVLPRQVIVVDLHCLKLVDLVFGNFLPLGVHLFLQDVLSIITDLSKEVVWSLGLLICAHLLKLVFVCFDLEQISLSLLVVLVVAAYAEFAVLAILSFGLQSAPVALHQ